MWRAGLEETKESWRRYAAGHLVWWNSARGTIVGLEPCLDGIEQLYRLLEVAYVDVPVRNVLAERGRVIVERSDNLFHKDGSVVAYAILEESSLIAQFVAIGEARRYVTGLVALDSHAVSTFAKQHPELENLTYEEIVASGTLRGEVQRAI